jgi:hypothetical protein
MWEKTGKEEHEKGNKTKYNKVREQKVGEGR